MWKRLGVGGTLAGVALAPFYVGWKIRPRWSKDTEFHDGQFENFESPKNALECWLHEQASKFVIFSTTALALFLMKFKNEIDIVDLDKLHKEVLGPRQGALLTVSNHHSVLDDPGLMSLLVPHEARVNPKLMRWSVCTEDICFSKGFSTLWFSLGQAIPILRGGSIYQKGIAALQEKVNAGKWGHIFSEGRCWQEGGTPLRDEYGRWCTSGGRCGPPGQAMGPLKWGVGKIVANATVPLTVLPIFHMGMQYIAPQSQVNEVITWDFSGTLISAQVGDPVQMRDLIDNYHTGAAARAAERNKKRRKELLKAIGGWSGGWLNWLWGWGEHPSSFVTPSPQTKNAPTSPIVDPAPAHIFTSEAQRLRDEACHLESQLLSYRQHLKTVRQAQEASTTRENAPPPKSLSYHGLKSFERPIPKLLRAPGREDPILSTLESQTSAPILRVEKRVLVDNVTTIPAYNEPPLLTAPPDHEFLSPEDALVEEEHRLRLYASISSRLEAALAQLESQVRARRNAKGWVEKRPMK